jgi:hypothetical protein
MRLVLQNEPPRRSTSDTPLLAAGRLIRDKEGVRGEYYINVHIFRQFFEQLMKKIVN